MAARMTLDQFRSRFPILGRRVYVNSCSQGALSIEVEAALAAFVESWHTHGSPWDRWVGEVERLRAAFAASIGADADEVAVMPSASVAIAAIATSLSFDRRRAVVLGDEKAVEAGAVGGARQLQLVLVDPGRPHRGRSLDPVEDAEIRGQSNFPEMPSRACRRSAAA